MIDLHTHILAGVDDGSRSLEESLAILSSMETKGVKKSLQPPIILSISIKIIRN